MKSEESIDIVLEDFDWKNNLQENLYVLWKNNCLCNASIFTSDAASLLVHGNVLACVSEYLKDHFQKNSILHTPTISSEIWIHILEFVYSGKMTVTTKSKQDYDNVVSNLSKAAKEMLIDKLYERLTLISSVNDNDGEPQPMVNGPPLAMELKQDHSLTESESDEAETIESPCVSPHDDDIQSSLKSTEASHPTILCPFCNNFTFSSSKWNTLDKFHRHLRKEHSDKNGTIQDDCLKMYEENNWWLTSKKYKTINGYVPTEGSEDVIGKVYVCPYCKMLFGRSLFYKSHLSEHTDACNVCYKCQVSFSERADLYKHFYNVHEMKSYTKTKRSDKICPTCGKIFKQAGHLKEHEAIHKGEKEFHCSHCGKMFLTEKRLKLHSKCHKGKSHHICSYCGFTESRKYRVHLHELKHIGEKPLKCGICGKIFTLEKNLVAHAAVCTVKEFKEKMEIKRNRISQKRKLTNS